MPKQELTHHSKGNTAQLIALAYEKGFRDGSYAIIHEPFKPDKYKESRYYLPPRDAE